MYHNLGAVRWDKLNLFAKIDEVILHAANLCTRSNVAKRLAPEIDSAAIEVNTSRVHAKQVSDNIDDSAVSRSLYRPSSQLGAETGTHR